MKWYFVAQARSRLPFLSFVITACTSSSPILKDVNAPFDLGRADLPDTAMELATDISGRDPGNAEIRADASADSLPTAEAFLDAVSDAAEVFVSPCGSTCTPETVCVWGTGSCETEMVLVPAGVFKMGCWGSYPDCDAPGLTDTLPAHEVDVSAFEIDRLEVTNADYRQCFASGECNEPYMHENAGCTWLTAIHDPLVAQYPVMGVNWFQAQTYCNWVGKRLCSESEWEKAARGSEDDRFFPWGWDDMTCKYATTDGNKGNPDQKCDEGGYPLCLIGCGNGDWAYEPVGSHPLGASPYGVLDMAGNVKEWVEDCYHEDYVGAPADGHSWLTPETGLRVIRNSYTFMREGHSPETDAGSSGIRCCRGLEPRSGGEP